MKYHLTENLFSNFLESEEGMNVKKIYVKGEEVTFGNLCFSRNGTAEDFSFWVTSNKVKQNLMEALNVTKIQSIEDLQRRLEIVETSTGNALNGIVKIQADMDGKIGIHIPGLLSLDNQSEDLNGTKGNMVLENPTADYLIRTESISPVENHIIVISGTPLQDEYHVLYAIDQIESSYQAYIMAIPKETSNYNLQKTSIVMMSSNRIFAPITKVLSQAAQGRTNLTIQDLPNSIQSIGYGAFSGCTSLVLTSLPKDLVEIESFAFSGCTSLGTINAISCTHLSTIRENAFLGAAGTLILSEPIFTSLLNAGRIQQVDGETYCIDSPYMRVQKSLTMD